MFGKIQARILGVIDTDRSFEQVSCEIHGVTFHTFVEENKEIKTVEDMERIVYTRIDDTGMLL